MCRGSDQMFAHVVEEKTAWRFASSSLYSEKLRPSIFKTTRFLGPSRDICVRPQTKKKI